MTWVDNEFSLIRGYLLGFHKKWIRVPREPLELDEADLRVDLSHGEAIARADGHVPGEFTSPLLVCSRFSVGSLVGAERIGKLKVSDHVVQEVSDVTGSAERVELLGHPLRVEQVIATRDSFDLVDVTAIDA